MYGTVDNIDLWVGALAEDHVRGASVGPLVQTIVADQFQRLRDGDRFWYQNVYSGALLQQIGGTTLADVLRRNSTATNVQSNVFKMNAEVTGRVFNDADANRNFGRSEQALAGITVELLNNAGEVIATTRHQRPRRLHIQPVRRNRRLPSPSHRPHGLPRHNAGHQKHPHLPRRSDDRLPRLRLKKSFRPRDVMHDALHSSGPLSLVERAGERGCVGARLDYPRTPPSRRRRQTNPTAPSVTAIPPNATALASGTGTALSSKFTCPNVLVSIVKK